MAPDEKPNSDANSDKGAAPGAVDPKEQQQPQAQEQPKVVSQEAYSKLQSRADRADADLKKAQEAADAARAERDRAEEAMRRSQREAQLANLKPEERTALIESFKLEDQRRELEESRSAVNEAARRVTIDSLVLTHGVKHEDLEGIDDVNEMRARAAELKAQKLEQELEQARAGNGNQPQTPPAQSREEPGKQVPAAMRDKPTSSGGGGGGSYDPDKFKGTGNLADAMRARRQAGEFESETIGVRDPRA